MIPDKIKGKIIACEYINLHSLVDPQYNEDIVLLNSDSSRGHSLKLNQPKK